VQEIKAKVYLWTGQRTCHDKHGLEVPCKGSGQDAEHKRGVSWPTPRFETRGEIVLDHLTGLIWTRNSNFAEFPVTWRGAFAFIKEMNRKRALGFSDWRLPNRRELRSLMSYQTRKPALPDEHPFENTFSGWYWTSTTAAINPAYAWYVHMEGARMFYSHKEQFFLLWPVRDEGNGVLPATGQINCYDALGGVITCAGSGQDGDLQKGRQWPGQRFEVYGDTVSDSLTGLLWLRSADLTGEKVTWETAIEVFSKFDSSGDVVWRLPNINELESLVDCSTHSPALPAGHLFRDVREGYWSSTTSMYEPDWAWALYLTKGAVGVGQKQGAHFHVWAVSDLQ
jgi:hypothetical protein